MFRYCAPCTITTTSWMPPSLRDWHHLAHTFNNWLDLYLVVVFSCWSVSFGMHHSFALLDQCFFWSLEWHNAVENQCNTTQPCVAHLYL